MGLVGIATGANTRISGDEETAIHVIAMLKSRTFCAPASSGHGNCSRAPYTE